MPPFPSVTRLVKHVKEVHLTKGVSKLIQPQDRSKNYVHSKRFTSGIQIGNNAGMSGSNTNTNNIGMITLQPMGNVGNHSSHSTSGNLMALSSQNPGVNQIQSMHAQQPPSMPNANAINAQQIGSTIATPYFSCKIFLKQFLNVFRLIYLLHILCTFRYFESTGGTIICNSTTTTTASATF